MPTHPEYDPTTYQDAAPHYARGRPAYSPELVPTLTRELGLDGTGRHLDVGCGPGILTLALASCFDESIGLDPDAGMLAEAAGGADALGVGAVRWVRALAEDRPALQLGTFSLVTFGQSFHRTDREVVAEAVYNLLDPGGAMVLVVHTVEGRPVPDNPGRPEIPRAEIERLIDAYLGPQRRSGQGFVFLYADRFGDALARTRFGRPRVVFAPGVPDLVRDIDAVVDNYFSMSWAAPHLFGSRRAGYEAELRELLHRHSPDGLFWEWPGDTEILIARKPA
jgi:SAM-dependent methyltransferase